MRSSPLLAAVILLPVTTLAGPISQTVDNLLKQAQGDLPKGWTASFEKETSCVIISRDEPVVGTVPVISGTFSDNRSEQLRFEYSFRVRPLMSLVEYERLYAENAVTEAKMSKLYKDLVTRRVVGKGFEPKTEADKADVARYEALEKSKYDLPGFYYGDISLRWIGNNPANLMKVFVEDDKVRAECERVRDNFLKLLSKYKNE